MFLNSVCLICLEDVLECLLTNLYTKATPTEWKAKQIVFLLLFEHHYLHNFTMNNILVISVLFTILKQINDFKCLKWVNEYCASAKLTFTRIKGLWLNTFSWNYFAPKHIGNPTAGLWKMRWANAVCDFAFPLCVYLPVLVVYGAFKHSKPRRFCFVLCVLTKTNYVVH